MIDGAEKRVHACPNPKLSSSGDYFPSSHVKYTYRLLFVQHSHITSPHPLNKMSGSILLPRRTSRYCRSWDFRRFSSTLSRRRRGASAGTGGAEGRGGGVCFFANTDGAPVGASLVPEKAFFSRVIRERLASWYHVEYMRRFYKAFLVCFLVAGKKKLSLSLALRLSPKNDGLSKRTPAR